MVEVLFTDNGKMVFEYSKKHLHSQAHFPVKRFPLTEWLKQTNGFLFSVYAIIASFGTYSCMYAYRKPFTAAGFADEPSFFGLDYKSALVIAQVIGYTLSKFAGIKVISEMDNRKRTRAILALIGIGHVSLLLFGLSPPALRLLFIFINGLPLGMVWGLVFSYLEGRRFTEFMGAGLCASFIFASGFVKTVGKALIVDYGITEHWMPFVTGAVFTLPLLLFTWMLAQIPPPSEDDILLRTRREPMNRFQRIQFFRKFSTGLVLLIITYTLLTAFRDLRDNFMNEVLIALGYDRQPELFTQTELPVTLGVLGLLALIMFIKNNHLALMVNHGVILAGLSINGLCTLGYQAGLIDPIWWIILTGFGAYMAYIPFNAILFERLIAAFRHVGNAGFLIYIADSFGYLGSVATLFYKNFGQAALSWLGFFIYSNYALSIVGVLLTLAALIYFRQKKPTG
ncbi:MAG: hypothetical protein KatS3mg031_0314 [Chitinophagales bacterium]|nr:MAG: hypothetical protein KatS3mg031_0314 [Chitinophagales bacterium]